MKRTIGELALVAALWAGAMLASAASPEKEKKEDGTDNMKARRILFLGNSITRHGPKADIGWTNDCGMAASALEKDYVHLLIDRIAGAAKRPPDASINNIADFERQYASYDLAPLIKKCVDFKADVVVLAIGENVPALASADAKARFKRAVAGLLGALKKDAAPIIFVRSSFWADSAKDAVLKEACEAVGGVFVDISSLGRDESNCARSERKFQHDGVAAHPGDKGMKAIADAIWTAMPTKPRPVPTGPAR